MSQDFSDWLQGHMEDRELARKFKSVADAVIKGTVNDVRATLADGADVNARKFGVTPLLLAVEEGADFAVIKTLLEAGADVTATNSDGKTALELAMEFDVDDAVLGALMKANKNTGANPTKAQPQKPVSATRCFADIFEAARDGVATDIEALLARGVDVNQACDNNVDISKYIGLISPLHIARTRDDYVAREAIKALIDAGANVNLESSANYGAWCWMVSIFPLVVTLDDEKNEVNFDVVKTLVNAGADVNYKVQKAYHLATTAPPQFTPIIFRVVETERTDVLKLFIDAGADVNARNNDDMTPLMCAVARNSSNGVVAELLAAGANVRVRDSFGRTILTVARANKASSEVINILERYGAR